MTANLPRRHLQKYMSFQYQSLMAVLNFKSCLTKSSFVFWPNIPRVHATVGCIPRGGGGWVYHLSSQKPDISLYLHRVNGSGGLVLDIVLTFVPSLNPSVFLILELQPLLNKRGQVTNYTSLAKARYSIYE